MFRLLLITLTLATGSSIAFAQTSLVPFPPPTSPGGRTLDLRKTEGGKQVAEDLKKLAQGNERDAGLDKLTFDPKTGEVVGEGWVRHKHVWRYKTFGVPQHQTVYDWTWKGKFKFNVYTGEGHGTVDLGRGAKVKTETIQRLLNGDISAALELLPNPGFKKILRNEYDPIKADYEKKYGKGNVYFASKRFVDWASPETAGERTFTAIVTAGANGGAVMKEVSRMSMLELKDFTAWLQAKGVRDAEATALAILSGKKVDYPFVALKWQTVGYFSQNTVLDKPVGPEIRSTHAGFVFIWKGNIGGNGGGRR